MIRYGDEGPLEPFHVRRVFLAGSIFKEAGIASETLWWSEDLESVQPERKAEEAELNYAHNAMELTSGLLAIAQNTMNVGVVKIVIAPDFIVSWPGRLAGACLDVKCRAARAIASQ